MMQDFLYHMDQTMADDPAADPTPNQGLLPTPTRRRAAPSDEKTRAAGAFRLGLGFSGAGTGSGTGAAGEAVGAGRDRWFGYAAQGALVVAIVGFGWAIGGHLYAGHQKSEHVAAETANRAKAEADQSELRKTTMAMATDVKALKTSLDSLRAAGSRSPTQDEMHALERNVDALKSKLDAAKTETAAALVQLGAKVDKAQTEPAAKLHDMADRLERIEKQTAAPITTASIPTPAVNVTPTPVPLSRAKQVPPAPEADIKKPPLITGWVVRDVYDGIALVEGPRGPLEVIPGVSIPGAGMVKSIERRGAGWIVVTTRGLVDYTRH